jgi:hypothetical protein
MTSAGVAAAMAVLLLAFGTDPVCRWTLPVMMGCLSTT